LKFTAKFIDDLSNNRGNCGVTVQAFRSTAQIKQSIDQASCEVQLTCVGALSLITYS